MMQSFSHDERHQLLVASIIFVIVELSSILELLTAGRGSYSAFSELLLILFVSGILILPLFLLHELAHKYTAIRYGFPANFYLDQRMAIFSLFTVILPLKIIAPGVIVWYGNPSSRIRANVSMIGPLVNIFIGGFLLLVSTILPSLLSLILVIISKASFDIAVFNLIPYSIFDGAKVYKWNQEVFYVIFSFTVLVWLIHPLGLLGGFSL